MNLTDILGIGGDQPLVDMNDDDEVSASARAPGSPTAPLTTGPDNPPRSGNFLDAILGITPDQGRQFRSSLGAGLTAVAQNYDKPAMAAFAAGAGGALAGKTAPPNLQNKLSALDRAIRARHAGDMDELKRALADLHWAQRAPQTAQYPVMPNAGAMAQAAAPGTFPAAPAQPIPPGTAAAPPLAGYADFRAWSPAQDVAPDEDGDRPSAPRSTFYDNILGLPLIGAGSPQPVRNDRAPDRPQAPAVAPAPPDPGADPDHDTVLHDTLRAAYVPPHRLDPGHLVGAAHLMANEGLAPADAYERVVLQSARECGLCDPELQDVYGLGAGGEASPASAPPDDTPEQRDLKRWPASRASMNEGRETGPSDSRAFIPAAPAAMPSVARDLAPLANPDGRAGSNDLADAQPATALQDERPEQSDLKRWLPSEPRTNEGRETGPSDSGPPVAGAQDPPLAIVPQPPTTEHSETRMPLVLAAMDESERRRLLGEKLQLPSGGGGGGGYGGSTATGRSPFTRPTSAFHYTFERKVSRIEREGLKAGQYATPTGNLSPMQAQIDLALAPNYGLRDVRLRIDLDGLRRDGYEIPPVTRVGRHSGMPGGGYEMQFPYPIPPNYITVIRP